MLRKLPRFVLITLLSLVVVPIAPTPAQALPPAQYIAAYSYSAQAVKVKYGVPASVALAQSILETGWGSSSLNQEANNFFGIKCSKTYVSPFQTGCYSVSTKEYYPDTGWTTVVAPFRRYPNSTNSFQDYGLFLRTNSRYANAFNYTNNYRQFIIEVHKAGYATDPTYSSKIISIIDGYQLWRFDGVNAVAVPMAEREFTITPASADPLVNSTATKASAQAILGLAGGPAPAKRVAPAPKVSAPATNVPKATASPSSRPAVAAAALDALPQGADPQSAPPPSAPSTTTPGERPLADTGIGSTRNRGG